MMDISVLNDRDQISGNSDLEHLYTYKNFPIFMGVSDSLYSNDVYMDMSWYIGKTTGIIQLNPRIKPEILYKNRHGSGTIGGLWDKHHTDFSKFIQKYNPKKIIEIGSGDGILYEKYIKSNEVDWMSIDPNVTKKNGLKTINSFFNINLIRNEDFDCIIHSHLIEHLYDLNKFFEDMSIVLKNDKLMIFSIPNFKEMLKNKYFNCLNFEHTIFLSEPYIEFLLAKQNIKILDKEYFKTDHSIFYSTKLDSHTKNVSLSNELYKENRQLFIDYVNYTKILVDTINEKMKLIDGNIYLFGAHIFSQYLISIGIDMSKIKCILDNDTQKHNRRLYGSELIVNPVSILNYDKNPCVILKAGVYNEEIKTDILNNINKSTTFIE